MPINVLDLFCGCGGMSWGLHKASEKFNIIAGIDNDERALQTFKKNHPQAIASNHDLSDMDAETWLTTHNIEPSTIDCIVGGSPCQGFSKNVPRSQRFLGDPRNLLLKRFLDFVDVIRPTVVVMENVAELVNAYKGAVTEEILAIFSEYGYEVDVQVIDAADFGVPQHRKRAFFLASRDGKIQFPEVSHWNEKNIPPLFQDQISNHVTVGEAIGDLPSLKHGEGKKRTTYPSPPHTPYQKKMRERSQLLHNHEAKKLSSIQYERLSSLAPGEGARELPEHLRPKSYYSGAYGRLTKDMVCRTITRWMFHAGSGRFGHPVDTRTITIREAARLQSFSDDFIFEGSFTQASSQLGNAVPPLLMSAFAPLIEKYIAKASKDVVQKGA